LFEALRLPKKLDLQRTPLQKSVATLVAMSFFHPCTKFSTRTPMCSHVALGELRKLRLHDSSGLSFLPLFLLFAMHDVLDIFLHVWLLSHLMANQFPTGGTTMGTDVQLCVDSSFPTTVSPLDSNPHHPISPPPGHSCGTNLRHANATSQETMFTNPRPPAPQLVYFQHHPPYGARHTIPATRTSSFLSTHQLRGVRLRFSTHSSSSPLASLSNCSTPYISLLTRTLYLELVPVPSIMNYNPSYRQLLQISPHTLSFETLYSLPAY
jgi:hypothetical protein